MGLINTGSVIIIDFGAQYTQLIARRVRELKVFSEIVPHDISLEELQDKQPAALILTGGPANVDDFSAPNFDERILRSGIPILGLCYGFQQIVKTFGGTLTRDGSGEFGRTKIWVNDSEIIPARSIQTSGNAAGNQLSVWMSHRVNVIAAPPGFKVTAHSADVPVEAVENAELKIYGVQFHPEVKHSEKGLEVFRKFLFEVVGLTPDWTAQRIVEQQVAQVQAQVADDEYVICGLSGGVDSAVAAALVHRALGERLIPVFVDHGLLRLGERAQVENDFQQALGLNLISVDASYDFLTALKGVTDPETKRKIIGEKFIRTFERVVREQLQDYKIRFLVQGTLYPDVVESGGVGANIKSHHNVGGLPETFDFQLIEPLRWLFKDEVRAIGRELSLPPTIIERQPFPGPGLAIRIIGEVTFERLEILRAADAIARQILTRRGYNTKIWQCPIVLLPGVRSVGVQGDARTYGFTLVLRPVDSQDAMTADFSDLPHALLSEISNSIINRVPQINRVVLDITSKPPATIEWE